MTRPPVPRTPATATDAADVAAHRAALHAVLARGTLSLENLWIRTFAIGGDLDLIDIEGYVHEMVELTPFQRDVLAHATNEHIDDLAGRYRVPYSREIRQPLSGRGPLTALVHLLKDTPRATAGELATVANEAAGHIGVEVVIYLADYEQQHLMPLAGPTSTTDTGPGRQPLDIESTLPGRVFQSGDVQPATSDSQMRWWLPLVDGSERLGVLDVMLADPRDLNDPHLRQQCTWLASLLAQLVLSADEHGDAIDAVRRTRARSPTAELMWSLLPPLTAGSDRFNIAGLLKPCYTVGGDAFDYALGADRVQLAVFDGMGHSLNAGLIAATALSVYRAERREHHDLTATAAAIGDAISGQFEDAFATGLLADLDLATGRLSYLAAGHAAPVLLRGDKVVAVLDGGRHLPFGLETGAGTLGQATLEPGDSLLLYTDGITEARNSVGDLFGEARLIDFLEREAMSHYPPAETVRRLIRSVLDHQGGALQDDATVLLAQWAPPPRPAARFG